MAPPTSQPSADSPARRAFEHLKALEGKWKGKSTKGWEDKCDYRVIAGGSVVMYTSFDAHPGQMMVTMFHVDGDRLLMTHYCAAKNQPRLCATKISEDGRELDFTFLDVTGIPSRDQGHMDRCQLNMPDADHMSERWTWYQNGTEKWMETIELTRASAAK